MSLPDASAPLRPAPRPNPAKETGAWLRDIVEPDKRFGSGLGLPVGMGAPLVGLGLGAGAGLLYHGIRNRLMPWMNDERIPKEKKPLAPATIGALLGLGLGGYTAYNHYTRANQEMAAAGHQKAQSHTKAARMMYDPTQDTMRLARIILNDYTMSERQKEQALAALRMASRQQVRRVGLAAVGGALSGAAVAAMLGVPVVGGAVAGGILGSAFFR